MFVTCAFSCYGPLNILESSINLPAMSLLQFVNLKQEEISFSVVFQVLAELILENCKAYHLVWNKSKR